jgi:hypothetical protein
VYGHAQLSWDRFAHSVLFLGSISSTIVLLPWLDIVITRDSYRAGVKHTTDYDCHLRVYWEFCCSIGHVYSCCRYLKIALLVAPALSLILFLEGRILGALGTPMLLLALFCSLLFGVLLPALPPNPSFPRNTKYERPGMTTLATMKAFIHSSLPERVLDTLSTRDATEPRDMSFGVRAVLEHLFDYGSLPDLDQNASLCHTYVQLTRCLLRRKDSLRVLELAAHMPCQDAPSWVPDYSQRAPYATVSTLKRTSGDSNPYLKYLSSNSNVLVVKGFIVGHVTESKHSIPTPNICRRVMDWRSEDIAERNGMCIQVKTTVHIRGGYCSRDCKVGDKVALIAGLHVPLIVRDDGNYVKIVAAASFTRRVMGGTMWSKHEQKRRKQWLREHASSTDSQILSKPDPAVYLPDILIS